MMGVESGFDDSAFRVIPDHSVEISHNIRREQMLIGGDADGFKIVSILALTRRLLNLLVGHEKTGKFVADGETQAVVIGEIALIARAEITRGAVVGVVLEDRRIQIAVGHRAFSADSERVLSPSVLGQKVAIGSGEAAARQYGFAVEALTGILAGDHLDDTAHFSSILGGNARGVDAHRLDVIGLDLRSKTR